LAAFIEKEISIQPMHTCISMPLSAWRLY